MSIQNGIGIEEEQQGEKVGAAEAPSPLLLLGTTSEQDQWNEDLI